MFRATGRNDELKTVWLQYGELVASTVDTILIVKAVGQYHLMSFCYFKYFVYHVTEECCPSNVLRGTINR